MDYTDKFIPPVITENKLRIGNFTSSEIHYLMKQSKSGSWGVPALTYIRKKKLEKRMGRSLSIDRDSRSMLWGKFMEQRVHELLPTSYQSNARTTLQHPTIKCWTGTPDNTCTAESVVGDTKCYEPLKFGTYVDTLTEAQYKEDINIFREENEQEFWQLVSNAIITGAKYMEAIVYMPYESELPEIRDMAGNYPYFDQYKYRFIAEAEKCELPYLPDGGFYKNLNVFRFEVPQDAVRDLTEKVLAAERKLNETP